MLAKPEGQPATADPQTSASRTTKLPSISVLLDNEERARLVAFRLCQHPGLWLRFGAKNNSFRNTEC